MPGNQIFKSAHSGAGRALVFQSSDQHDWEPELPEAVAQEPSAYRGAAC